MDGPSTQRPHASIWPYSPGAEDGPSLLRHGLPLPMGVSAPQKGDSKSLWRRSPQSGPPRLFLNQVIEGSENRAEGLSCPGRHHLACGCPGGERGRPGFGEGSCSGPRTQSKAQGVCRTDSARSARLRVRGASTPLWRLVHTALGCLQFTCGIGGAGPGVRWLWSCPGQFPPRPPPLHHAVGRDTGTTRTA